ncbi:MAG: MFS transporter [Pseudomonadota bacterium]
MSEPSKPTATISTTAPSGHVTAVFLGSAPFVLINFGLPLRADDLGVDAVGIGFMYTLFTGAMLVFRPLVGAALDRYGRRWFFVSAFGFYAASMAVFARSVDVIDFYVARTLQGVGAALMWVSARTIIADLYDLKERGGAMGRMAAASAQGSMVGATFGFTLLGFLPFAQAWMWAFSGYAVLAVLALLWSWWKVNETRSPAPQQTSSVNWRALLSRAPVRRLFVIVFLSMFGSALIEPIYLLYLKNKYDVGVMLLAWVFLPAGVVFAILPRYAGNWSDRFGRAPLIATGVCFAGLVSAALPFWPSLWMIAVSYVLFSIGWAVASPAEDALVADLAPADLRGTLIGAKEAAGGLGAATGPLLGGYIYEYHAQEAAFVVNGVILLITAFLALLWFREQALR